MLRVQTKKNGVVSLRHFDPVKAHVETLTRIVRDDKMANMSLSCDDAEGRPTSVPAFEVEISPSLLRQLNPDMP